MDRVNNPFHTVFQKELCSYVAASHGEASHGVVGEGFTLPVSILGGGREVVEVSREAGQGGPADLKTVDA